MYIHILYNFYTTGQLRCIRPNKLVDQTDQRFMLECEPTTKPTNSCIYIINSSPGSSVVQRLPSNPGVTSSKPSRSIKAAPQATFLGDQSVKSRANHSIVG
uniref:Uncharacterized protein n=1 Tax=Cacopsylla melanoneura TaxID=428564 RepID=A0A8D8YRC4_9HEMI